MAVVEVSTTTHPKSQLRGMTSLIAIAILSVQNVSSFTVHQCRAIHSPTQLPFQLHHPFQQSTTLYSQTNNDESMSAASTTQEEEEYEAELTEQDWKTIEAIHTLTSPTERIEAIQTQIQTMHPRLIVQLQRGARPEALSILRERFGIERAAQLSVVGEALESVLDDTLSEGKSLLAELLACGEIRKLDGAIGRAAVKGRLDAAFFAVLNANIRNAIAENENENGNESSTLANEDNQGADRLQILQHIQTRCQEEAEKSIMSPGRGLLNKLLRTTATSIRSNQLRHYLGPQTSQTIITPDGTKVELEGGGKALVPPDQLIEALASVVQEIRTVERSGGTDRGTAASLVESCRQVAIEARLAIAEVYGEDSEVLREFEGELQPVFRPVTSDSPYIRGN